MPNPYTTGGSTSVLWGQIKLSAEGGVSTVDPTKATIDVPPTLEGNHRYQAVGSAKTENMTFQLSRSGQQLNMMTALEAETAYPMVRYIRGTAGGLFEFTDDVRLATDPATDSPDALQIRELAFAAEGIYRLSLGLLFDHTMAHSVGGVTAAVNGTGVQVGAVSATQSVTIFWANPHDPAPTVAGGVAHVESDATDAWIGAETTRGVAFAAATSTPAYETQTVAGPITDTWWRLSITAVTSGTFYPVCGIIIHDT